MTEKAAYDSSDSCDSIIVSFNSHLKPGKHTGLQRRICNVTPFSIYVNCICKHLALCFNNLFDQFSWFESIDRLLFGLRKGLYYCRKNCHIFKSNQGAYTLKVMGENRETNHLKNFNNANEIIQKIENYQ